MLDFHGSGLELLWLYQYPLRMQAHLRTRILELTGADSIVGSELIQPLWNNYGTLSRIRLKGGVHASVIVKHIQIPKEVCHPRGFATSISRSRKVRSYQAETHWYRHQNQQVPSDTPTPKCLDAFSNAGELFLLLEDLSNRGFSRDIDDPSWNEIQVVLQWLAGFHAEFLGDVGEGLWPCGTYWHLETRPDELANIEGTRIHRFASFLDARLRFGEFSTLVHGDAKLANFLFSNDGTQVAAVDFQYVGRGSAMKDVAYFIGSCLSGLECERQEEAVLDSYFAALRPRLPAHVESEAIESEWRDLCPVAWADFQRFMMGWSPGHRKLTDYSDATTERALEQITQELMGAAREACLAAGRFIQSNRDKPLTVSSKGFASQAADVVTEIDIQAQEIILDILRPTISRYGLGVLGEEGLQDDSRLRKHAFWAIDPLDGTQYFIEGSSGYATSIALVSHSGATILGVVYDPGHDHLYASVVGGGVTRNGVPFGVKKESIDGHLASTLLADRSLRNYPQFSVYEEQFSIRYVGGAVMNALQLLTDPSGVYLKPSKKPLGGCAIWDLAAVSLMVAECGGHVCSYGGGPLPLNRSESVFFNDLGFVFAGANVDIHAMSRWLAEMAPPESS